MTNNDDLAQKELYAKVEKQAHSLRGNPLEYMAITGMCPVNVIEMHAQKIQALLAERDADKAEIAKLHGALNTASLRLEDRQDRIEALEGEIEVSKSDLFDTEDAMHLWAERGREAERRIAELEIESAVKDSSILELKQQYQRLLAARTVSVKPAEEYPDDFDLQAAINMNDDYADYQTAQWLKELRRRRAAGINLEVGEWVCQK